MTQAGSWQLTIGKSIMDVVTEFEYASCPQPPWHAIRPVHEAQNLKPPLAIAG